ncbi:glycosyltransferase [Acetobacter nitrogenifigens DSM 23921 = NBRC 105050]|uniref:Mannosyltransferase n=1 Tax=Acetobacter nitrogenifigens DSM 23921 = NBRC 105050 TaxID=1120919 RepID=A0A511XCZ5_9PROT|nr:glycosyltransferase family 1 protein [Acetobacter nitrogenifigens]GBQ91569.1 glycosyltransferase [Acetobacter nitrogenifigens DSM 23921 = NBRC 105050]GEN60828.1 mannosyltransferase [Acetobacter nitrogenifigens DSM 23921 = NBRC 105050]
MTRLRPQRALTENSIIRTRTQPVSCTSRAIRPWRNLSVNGKFLSGYLTGVHRVGLELSRELGERAEEIAEIVGGGPLFRTPGRDHPAWINSSIPTSGMSARGVSGQVWEQVTLLRQSRTDLLLNLCNLGPALHPAMITMIHDAQTFITPESYTTGFGRFYRALLPALGRRSLRVLTVSDFSAQELARWDVAPTERIRVIPNGVDHVLRVRPDRNVLRRIGARPFVLALASAQRHKRIGTLIRAFSDPRLAHLDLILFGPASPTDFARSGHPLPPNARCLSFVSDEEVRALMEAALCFALPSTTEGFGLPPLEAMLIGCPAIVSRAGALPGLCGEDVLYASPDDPGEWVEAIRRLADDPEMRRHRAAVGRRRAARYTWRHAGDALMAVLREVSDERRSATTP